MKKVFIALSILILALFFTGFPYRYEKSEVSALVFTKDVYYKSSSTTMVPAGKIFVPIINNGGRRKAKNQFGIVYDNIIKAVKSEELYDQVEPGDYIDVYHIAIKNRYEKVIIEYLKLK